MKFKLDYISLQEADPYCLIFGGILQNAWACKWQKFIWTYIYLGYILHFHVHVKLHEATGQKSHLLCCLHVCIIYGFVFPQVVAFNMSHFDSLRKKLMESGSSRLTFAYLSKYMSPLFAKNIGRVMVTSGERNLIDWVNEILTRKDASSQTKFPSLVSLSWKPWLLDQIVNRIDTNAVLSLRLDSFDRAFTNSSPVVQWYREITTNALKLREVNSQMQNPINYVKRTNLQVFINDINTVYRLGELNSSSIKMMAL